MKKYLLISIAAIILMSCGNKGLSEKEKYAIGSAIELHLINLKLANNLDRIRFETKINRILIQTFDDKERREIELQKTMHEYDSTLARAQKMYKPNCDSTLTLDKYLEYCDKWKLNPKTYIREWGKPTPLEE